MKSRNEKPLYSGSSLLPDKLNGEERIVWKSYPSKFRGPYYIDKNYHIKERPCPIKSVTIQANYNGIGFIALNFVTPLSRPILNQQFAHLNNTDYTGHGCEFEFDLNQNKEQNIAHLFENVFNRLINLTSNPQLKTRFSFMFNDLHPVLIRYFKAYKNNFSIPPLSHCSTDDTDYADMGKSHDNAAELFHAVVSADIEETCKLLSQGIDPDSYYKGQTLLNAAIGMGVCVSNLSRMSSIIRLLLEYGANPLQESFNVDAFESVVNRSFYNIKIHSEYWEFLIKLLMGAEKSSNFSYVSTEPQEFDRMNVLIHGSNMFFKNMSLKKNQYPKIARFSQNNTNFYYTMSDDALIRVNMCSPDDLTPQCEEQLLAIFKANFQWEKHFANDREINDYFYKILRKSSNIIDIIYINNVLSGFNVAEIVSEKDDALFLHYIKLASANAPLRNNYKRFMSIVSFAKGFAVQADFPQSTVLTFFEAASVSSYLQVNHLDVMPKIQSSHLKRLLYKTASKLDDTVCFINNQLYIKDKLAASKTSPAPISFWDEKSIAIQGFESRYQKDQHSLLMGFLNDDGNLHKLENKINAQCCGVAFKDIINAHQHLIDYPATMTGNAKL